METIRHVEEAEVIWQFLRAEWDSARFGEHVRHAMAAHGCPDAYILQPQLDNLQENACRAQVLGAYRGWGRNEEIFAHFPPRVEWSLARCGAEDLDAFRYIRYSYWDEISQWTGRPSAAAATIRQGVEIFGVSNAPMLYGEQFLQEGGSFPPLMALTCGDGRYILLEGHSRMTVYALAPNCFSSALCYIGVCGSAELRAWGGSPIEDEKKEKTHEIS